MVIFVLYASTTVKMVLDALLVVVVLVCLFVCLFCHCKITAYVGDNKLILILSFYLIIKTKAENRLDTVL